MAYAPATHVLFFTTTLDHTVRAFSTDQWRLLDTFGHSHPSPPTTLAVSSDAGMLVSCSAAPPTIHVQCLETNKPPILLKSGISDAIVVAATFHLDRPGIFALAFADGSLAAYDAKRLIGSNDEDIARAARSRERTSAELGYLRGVHAIMGCPAHAVESIAFVPGFHWRLVSVGGDGQCCVVYLRRKGGFGGKMVKRWHIGAAATSLAILVPSSRDVGQVSQNNRAGKRDLCGDDAILAVGREDGEVAVFDLGGVLIDRRRICPVGAKVLSLEWQTSAKSTKKEVRVSKKRSSSTRLCLDEYMARSSTFPIRKNNSAQANVDTLRVRRSRKASLRYLPGSDYSITHHGDADPGDASHKSSGAKVIASPSISSTGDEMKHRKRSNRFSLESEETASSANSTPRFTILDPKSNTRFPRSPKKPTQTLLVHKRSKRATRMPLSPKAIGVDRAPDNSSNHAGQPPIASLNSRMESVSIYSSTPSFSLQDCGSSDRQSQHHMPTQQGFSTAGSTDASPSRPPRQSMSLQQQTPNNSATSNPEPLPGRNPHDRQAPDFRAFGQTSTSNDTVVSWIAAYHKANKTGLRSRNSTRWDPPNSSRPRSSSASPPRNHDLPRTPSPPSTSNSTVIDWGTSGLLRNPRISPFHRETRIPSKINHTPRNGNPVTPATVVKTQDPRDRNQGENPLQFISFHPTPKLPPPSPTDPLPPNTTSNPAPATLHEFSGPNAITRQNNPTTAFSSLDNSSPTPIHAHLDAMESRLHAEIQDLRRDMLGRFNAHRRELDEEARRQEGGLRKLLEENGELRKELSRVEKRAKGLRKVKSQMDCFGRGGGGGTREV